MRALAGLSGITVLLVVTACTSDRRETAETPTFTKHIAPIVFTHCLPCHRPGQPVPFTLASYDEVKARSAAIAHATQERRMPPWLPDRTGVPLQDARGLQDADITLIDRWVKGGTPQGDVADLPPTPSWPAGWQLGTPDLVVTMPQPYALRPGAHDVYRNVILPVALPADRYVRALEFRPGSTAVHHAVIRIDRTRASRARDGADGQPGFDGMVAYDVQDPDGHFLGWAPGRGPIAAPEGMPWRLDRASDLVVELHLMTGAEPMAIQPSVGLFFSNTPPTKTPVMIVMGSKTIDIPPGERAYAIEDSYRLPVGAQLLSVYPHAHFLGREMDVRLTLPDGTVRPLLHIPRWNFRWQQDYRFTDTIMLPSGTTIAMRYTYDNSDANRDNPHNPPRRVMVGPQSTDEMGNLGVQLLPQSPADAATLTRSFAEHALRIDLAAGQMLVEREPASAHHRAFLGTTLVRLGRLPEAIEHLERARQLDPQSASAENYLGGALLALGRPQEALPHFRRASELAPRDEHLHFNLGRALEAVGRDQEAARAYERALRLNPQLAEAHQQLAVVLFAEQKIDAAIDHLRQSAELLPGSADVQSDLGGALAQMGRYAEARVHLERALQLDPAHPSARANLARLPR